MAGRKPGEADGTLTVQCEWFPVEAAAARQPDVWRRGEETCLETEARLFGGAVRTVFNRLVEAMAKKPESATTVTTVAERAAASRLEWKQRLQTDFGLSTIEAKLLAFPAPTRQWVRGWRTGGSAEPVVSCPGVRTGDICLPADGVHRPRPLRPFVPSTCSCSRGTIRVGSRGRRSPRG